MKIKEKLIELLEYYNETHKVGHTTLMKVGVDNYPDKKFVLAYNYTHSHDLNIKKDDIVTWNNLEKLHGRLRPLAIDNETMYGIINESIQEINQLESEIKRLKKLPRFLRFLMS